MKNKYRVRWWGANEGWGAARPNCNSAQEGKRKNEGWGEVAKIEPGWLSKAFWVLGPMLPDLWITVITTYCSCVLSSDIKMSLRKRPSTEIQGWWFWDQQFGSFVVHTWFLDWKIENILMDAAIGWANSPFTEQDWPDLPDI